ncbi:S1 family peptidase [Dactylosporangium sp. NPDC050688]|uniref:S1 family peptidase n=1 Tax=Dactylosporangium sp. NPDC050688 TaxID=3157217 RepID=UPI0033FB7AEE
MRRTLLGVLVAAAILLPATDAAAASGTATAAPVQAFAATPGTAWWDDGRLTVSIDDSVRPALAAGLTRAVIRAGGTVLHEPGTLAPHIAGGDTFNAGALGGRCLIGFNARAGATYYFLAAAHCVPAVGATVYAGTGTGTVLGVVAARDLSYDSALVRYTNTTIAKPSAVDLYAGGLQPITSFGSGTVGQAVRRTGPNGVRSGTITSLNVTINYAGGTLYNMIRTTVCSEPGESGGPLFAGTVGIGINWGGSGNCASGGASYYSSVRRAATTYGVAPY